MSEKNALLTLFSHIKYDERLWKRSSEALVSWQNSLVRFVVFSDGKTRCDVKRSYFCSAAPSRLATFFPERNKTLLASSARCVNTFTGVTYANKARVPNIGWQLEKKWRKERLLFHPRHVNQGKSTILKCTVNDRKNVPPCNHLDIGALWLPTLTRLQTITCLIPGQGRQPLRTDVQVVAGGGTFFLSMIVQEGVTQEALRKKKATLLSWL